MTPRAPRQEDAASEGLLPSQLIPLITERLFRFIEMIGVIALLQVVLAPTYPSLSFWTVAILSTLATQAFYARALGWLSAWAARLYGRRGGLLLALIPFVPALILTLPTLWLVKRLALLIAASAAHH